MKIKKEKVTKNQKPRRKCFWIQYTRTLKRKEEMLIKAYTEEEALLKAENEEYEMIEDLFEDEETLNMEDFRIDDSHYEDEE